MNFTAKDIRLDLYANWASRRRDLGAFVDAAAGFIRRLQQLHPLFGKGLHIVGSGPDSSPPLQTDLGNLQSFALEHGWDKEATRSLYSNLSADNEPTLRSMSELGFRLHVGNLHRTNKDAVQVTFFDSSASPWGGGGVGIDLPFTEAPQFWETRFLRELLAEVVDYWDPEFAGITNNAITRAVVLRKVTPYVLPVGWMNYVDDRSIISALPDEVDVQSFGKSGVVFMLQDTPPINDLDATIQKALRVRDALLPGQWLTCRDDRTVNREGQEQVKYDANRGERGI